MRQLVRKDNEAYAIQRNMRVSPSKANAVLEMIRGKKASEALNLLKFSPRGVAKYISKVFNSAIANAGNTPINKILVVIIACTYTPCIIIRRVFTLTFEVTTKLIDVNVLDIPINTKACKR